MAIVGKNSEINRYSGALDKVKIFIFRSCKDVYKRQSDTCTVFAGQPVSQLPEHDTVDITAVSYTHLFYSW